MDYTEQYTGGMASFMHVWNFNDGAIQSTDVMLCAYFDFVRRHGAVSLRSQSELHHDNPHDIGQLYVGVQITIEHLVGLFWSFKTHIYIWCTPAHAKYAIYHSHRHRASLPVYM